MKVIVIGGGAAGMVAAISAKRNGADVIILERNSRVGKKILATGNGRCNYTNKFLQLENYHGKNSKFVYSPLSQFGVEETISFFETLGIAPAVEEGGKVFPLSFQASSVLDVLRYELEDLGIRILCDAFVKDVKKKSGEFLVQLSDGRKINGDRVIIATGGKAMPSTGSDGNGYDLAKKLGHSIVEVFPGLVQLKLEENFLKSIAGVKVVGTASLIYKNKILREDKGDILFTNYGISGPPILQISRKALEFLNNGKKPILKVSIIDSMDKEELKKRLKIRFNYMPKKSAEIGLIGLINKKLIPVILRESKIDKSKKAANLSNEDIENLANILTNWRFEIKGSKSWDNAQVTAGGIDTKDIDSSTMESKLIKGLYFAGEIIDIDGDCGGFNLQWAWSSGYIAGESSAIK
ncbi:NAD(P)/FAD-dependent oxidoreductase [Anaerosalibacter bizertensis]|uniref:NAD(P)/FAD-dependent oxidoreductase n=1 Tax=Anaerosalibacter bizertensis TaxID=932217 RepID=A0A9Q4ADF8_9FIRM|nr:NAD(P)/FAD-dependent oxidoreductase [Anaerosalibacter bizertensis]MCG4565677.1 NAD(P)/FAD-dependent oxidoreductase [Anaerosalibacter bizertensis]